MSFNAATISCLVCQTPTVIFPKRAVGNYRCQIVVPWHCIAVFSSRLIVILELDLIHRSMFARMASCGSVYRSAILLRVLWRRCFVCLEHRKLSAVLGSAGDVSCLNMSLCMPYDDVASGIQFNPAIKMSLCPCSGIRNYQEVQLDFELVTNKQDC